MRVRSRLACQGGSVTDQPKQSTPGADSDEESASRSVSFTLGTTAGVAVLFLILRLLAISGWDWSTVGAVADTFSFSDAPAIFLGTLLGSPTLTGILLGVLLPLSVVRLAWPVSAGGQQITAAGLLLPVALLASTAAWVGSFHAIWVVVLALGVALVAVLARLLARHGRAHDIVVHLIRSVGLFAVAGFLALAVLVDTPWMSHERIVLDDSTIEGYVLSTDSNFVRILTDEREVIIVQSWDVQSRTIIS